MKNWYSLVYVFLMVFSFNSLGSAEDVLDFAVMAEDYVSSGTYEGGFKVKRLKNTPFLKKGLLKYLNGQESVLTDRFVDFVINNPDEFGSSAQYAIDHPKKYLGVPYLLEINKVFKIYRDGKHIGYAIECSDHVDAAIIQDGSWRMIYTDKDQNVLTVYNGQA
jgi:hypothetical protein